MKLSLRFYIFYLEGDLLIEWHIVRIIFYNLARFKWTQTVSTKLALTMTIETWVLPSVVSSDNLIENRTL